MAFILIPTKGEDITINAWNWRPTLEFLRSENVLTDQDCERLAREGGDSRVDADLACCIAAAIESKLSTMKPGDRIRADLTVTDAPKISQVFAPDSKPEDIDVVNLYSATYDWLVKFKDFCRSSQGFEVA